MSTPNERNLRDVARLLTEKGIFFWADQGTLLGIVRDDCLLPWDKDIDLSTWPEEFDKIVRLEEDFKRLGFYFEVHEYKDCLFLTREVGYAVEIARYTKEGDVAVRKNNGPRNSRVERLIKRGLALLPHAIHCKLRDLGRRWHVKETIHFRTPAHHFASFRRIRFRDLELNVPAETESYLEFKYGPNWRTPIQDWNYELQDGSMKASRGQR